MHLAIAIAVLLANPAVPAPDLADRFWRREHARFVQHARNHHPPVVFLGDSITAGWMAQGEPLWSLHFKPAGAACYGIAGDRTENLLYRISAGEIPTSKPPDTIVLLIGTNNLSKPEPDEPRAVADAIKKLVEQLHKLAPRARIALLSILPNGRQPGTPLRGAIVATNALIAPLGDHPAVSFIDVHDTFLTPDDRFKPHLTTDGTHLTLSGYDRLAEAVRPYIASGN